MSRETGYNIDIDKINAQLEEKYGKEAGSKRAIYRIVHSNYITEKRLGLFRDFHGAIFIREVREVREVLKYGYLRDTWVLEKLVWTGGSNPELPEATGYDYECIWAFRDAHGTPLYPYFNIVELFLNILLNGPREKRTEKDDEYDEEQKKLKEAQQYFEMLESDGRSNLFAFEDAVAMDSTKVFKEAQSNPEPGKLGESNE